jgi:hypothetical protein
MADGEIVADSDWESKDGHYRVRLENKWFDVDNSVITEPNRAGPDDGLALAKWCRGFN